MKKFLKQISSNNSNIANTNIDTTSGSKSFLNSDKNIRLSNENDEIDYREENDDENDDEEEEETSETEALREKFQKNRIFKILKEFFTKPTVSQNNNNNNDDEDKKDSDDSKNSSGGNNIKKKESTEEKFLANFNATHADKLVSKKCKSP
jgi:hypothetical protein